MNTVEMMPQEGTTSMQTSIKVKKCDSELSDTALQNQQISGDAAIGGRTNSNDIEANKH